MPDQADLFVDLELRPAVRLDDRGMLVKVFDPDLVRDAAPDFRVAEIFWTRSARGVVRGLHFQTPPAATAKLVFCPAGRVFDVVVDLRRGSSTYGEWQRFLLSPEMGNVVYVPLGFAHGFCALEDDTVVGYAQSAPFDPDHDAGIHWNSVGVPWPVDFAIVSARDSTHPSFEGFASPFGASE